jgi:hypothetical protein
MQVKLLGTRALDFSSNDGDAIKGLQLFICFPEESVAGEMTDKLFIREGFAIPTTCKPGDILDISFNRKGKPESIKQVAKQANQ